LPSGQVADSVRPAFLDPPTAYHLLKKLGFNQHGVGVSASTALLAIGLLVAVAAGIALAVHRATRDTRPPLVASGPAPLYIGAAPLAGISDRLVAAWYVGRRLARQNLGRFPAPDSIARSLEKFRGISAQVGALADATGVGRIVVDRQLSNERTLVLYTRSPLGSVWQVSGSVTGRPAATLGGSYAAAVLAASPVGYWPLDSSTGRGSVPDESGNGNTGRIAGQVDFGEADAPGITAGGTSALFHGRFGQRSRINLFVPQVDTRPGAFNTAEFWMQATSTAFRRGQMPFSLGFYNVYTAPRLRVGFNTGNSDFHGARLPGSPYGWHYVVAIFYNGNPDRSRLWVDGRRLKLVSDSTGITASVATHGAISGWQANFDNSFDGHLDDVALYPYALPPAVVLAHWHLAQRLIRHS
jgi:hypothetical protein